MYAAGFPSRPLCLAFFLGAVWLLPPRPVTAQPGSQAWGDTVLANRLFRESEQFHHRSVCDTALEKIGQSLEIYTRLYGEDHVKTAKARMYVARELRNTYQEAAAAVLFRQSLQTYETAHDTFQTALCHLNLGLCLRSLHRYTEARTEIQEAINLLRPDSIVQASVLADMNLSIGSLLIDEMDYRAAIPVLEASKAVYTQKKNVQALGQTSYFLGNAYFGLHDFVRAKEYFLASMDYLKRLISPDHSYFADLNVKIGQCYHQLGDPETCLAHLLAARSAYLNFGQDDPRYIDFLQDLGGAYLEERMFPEAIQQLAECLSLKEKHYAPQNPRLMGTLQALGEADLQAAQFDRAETCFRRCLKIAREALIDDDKFLARFYARLAELRLVQGDYSGALQHCDTAFTIAGFDPRRPEKMLPRDHFRELCQLYARACAAQYRATADSSALIRAEHFFALAGETLYREVEEITVKSSRELQYDRDHQVLEQWLEARMQLYAATGEPEHAEAAFRIAGQSKAFLLAEAMRRNGSLHFAGVPDSVLQQELSLRERIVAGEKTLDTCRVQGGAEKYPLALQLNLDLSSWRMEYDALLQRIEVAYPEYYRLRLLRREVSPAELRRTALAPDQALLLFSLTDSAGYAFVLTRDTLCALRLPLDAGFNEQLENFLKSLTAYFATADPDDALYDRSAETYVALAQALYRQLILPVAALLPQRVVVVPEGKLCYLPFEALLMAPPQDQANFKTYPFWTLQKAVSYGLSTDFLLETAEPSPQKAEKNWLGVAPFADPAAKGQIAVRGVLRDQFGPLPESGREVTAIAALLQGETWLGRAARPGRFRKEALRYRILHLATHSRADDRQGDYSYLATAFTGEALPAKDLYQFPLAAEMIVLSSCEAGGGQLLRGEGIIGLVRAFTFAGARSIVASQWVANDRSTANLMIDFYRNLRSGMPKDLALQSARVHLINQAPAEGHPFFWAGFRVFGNVGAL